MRGHPVDSFLVTGTGDRPCAMSHTVAEAHAANATWAPAPPPPLLGRRWHAIVIRSQRRHALPRRQLRSFASPIVIAFGGGRRRAHTGHAGSREGVGLDNEAKQLYCNI